jgi:hypothetical protein
MGGDGADKKRERYAKLARFIQSLLNQNKVFNISKIGVRITPEDRKLLGRVCKARGEDISDFVRRSVPKELASLSFLSAEDMKARGINPQ